METSSIEKKEVWEYLSSEIGYMALLRNLKGMEDAGISRDIKSKIASRISDKDEVARSRQLPFRFMNAYRELQHVGYNYFLPALEDALEYSLANVPVLDGKTLIVIDNSGSMYGWGGSNGKMTFADTANLFGVALAKRANDATVVVYGSNSEVLDFRKGASTFHVVKGIRSMGGTTTGQTIERHYKKDYTRVVVLTDEQYGSYYGYRGDPYSVIEKSTPVYTWNLNGYKSGNKAETNRYTLGGLTDASFRTIPLVEASKDEQWPWEVDNKS